MVHGCHVWCRKYGANRKLWYCSRMAYRANPVQIRANPCNLYLIDSDCIQALTLSCHQVATHSCVRSLSIMLARVAEVPMPSECWHFPTGRKSTESYRTLLPSKMFDDIACLLPWHSAIWPLTPGASKFRTNSMERKGTPCAPCICLWWIITQGSNTS